MTFQATSKADLFFFPTKIPDPNISQTSSIIDEVKNLIEFCPEISERIEKDLDDAGIVKKISRIKDEEWLAQQSSGSLFSENEKEL